MSDTFASLAAMDGRGLMWMVDVSFDNFATTTYRWATHSGDVGIYTYERRILEMGNIVRAFGQDHLPTSSTTSLVLDNIDFGVDWMVNRLTVATQVFAARFKISVGLTGTDQVTYQPNVVQKYLGTFVCLDFPERDDRQVTVALADDSLGALADLLVAPTFNDWYSDAGTTSANAVFVGQGPDVLDPNTPYPLQFGAGPFIGIPIGTYTTPLQTDFGGMGARENIFPIVVCATRDSAAVTGNDVTELRCIFKKDVDNRPDLAGTIWKVPQTYMKPASPAPVQETIWTAYKTQTITKNGYDWKLLWIAFDVAAYSTWGATEFGPNPANTPGNPNFNEIPVGHDYQAYGAPNGYFDAFEWFQVDGQPGSGITGKAEVIADNAIDTMQDFVTYYSSMGASAIDTARFARARLACPIRISGSVFERGSAAVGRSDQQLSTNVQPYGIGSLRKVIADLAASADLDVFVTTEGKVAVVTQGADFETQTTTYTAIDEERVKDLKERIPSAGERWQPYNRVFLLTPNGEQIGPADDAAAITTWGRIISKVLQGMWWAELYSPDFVWDPNTVLSFLWGTRNLEAKVRPIISFTMIDLTACSLELGDYFYFSWTRSGLSAVYSAAIFRLESMTIHPSNGTVDITAVWMGDLQTEQPYLLDNETYLVRTSGVSHTLTVTTGSTTVARSAGSFISDGVTANDVLVMRDTSEASGAFTRNRHVKVVSVTDATHVVVADSVFGSAGAHVISAGAWSILRSFITYPTVGSDPTNYPSGSAMYGKISDTNGLYGDASQANKLLDG